MTLDFTARIDGADILCRITSDRDLAAPVFCFSLLAPPAVTRGGTLKRHVGGYGEVQLPDLRAGEAHEVALSYANAEFRPVNRAWLPLGAYLRLADGNTLELPPLPAGVHPAKAAEVDDSIPLRLIPRPHGVALARGTLYARAFSADHEAFRTVDALGARCGMEGFLAEDGVPVEIAEDLRLPPEGYRMTLRPDGVQLTARDRAGVFHGAITLLTLRQTHGGALPCGTLDDAPRFGWRGQHLDCARHYFAPATILRLLDLMALMKLNRFHWHFNDDEAFRLEVETAPDIWQRSAFRGEGELIPGVFGGGPRSGGSYSRDDVREILAHAASLNIQVLPEIEFPAHALAMIAARPDLRDPADTTDEVSVQGYVANAVNPARAAVWELLPKLAEEIAALFPIGMVHLGCDELAPRTWDDSPAAAALKAQEGLSTRDDLQGWAMARLAGHLAERGIRSAAWEEAARGGQGGIGHDALLFSWTGQGPGIEAARQGHDVIMCPAQHVYFDMAHTGEADDWGASWAAFVSLEDTLAWEPVPEGADDIAERIKGVQGAFWGEFTTHDRQMEPMIAPRILGLAAKAWDRGDALTGAELRGLVGHYGGLFDAMGWDWHRGA